MTSKLSPDDLDQLSTPLGFSRGVLKMDLYSWAQSVLCDLDKPGAVALKAANGSGKTTRVAGPAALWHAAVFPGSLTLCISGVFRQVKNQLFPSIRAHSHRFPTWNFLDVEVESHHGSKILGFSADNPNLAEGFHNDNLLIIADESKSIPDPIFQAMERCQASRVLLLSSPGGCSGTFYEAFHSRRKFYKTHSVTAYDCPHIPASWIEEQIAKHGVDDPFIRSMIFAEFMSLGEDGVVIPLGFIERCLLDPPEFLNDNTVNAFCDFAAGGDENVLAIRRGNKVEVAAAWREKNTMRAVGKFIRLFGEHGLKSEDISADAGGLGAPMCDALGEAGFHVTRVNNGSPANDSAHYANLGAEMWYEARKQLERQQTIIPNDPELIGQLTSRRGWANSKGKLELESKEQMRGRGIGSPDRADAILGAMRPSRSCGLTMVPTREHDPFRRRPNQRYNI